MPSYHGAELRTAAGNLQAARQARDEVIRIAHRDGKMSYREIAQHVLLSHQRVAQIIEGGRQDPEEPV